ncbi:MAG: hypothetical protein KF897_11170 [Opitutaceae bacterium]|nr:hypothetical protein [Opitutaceae bacterium]
MSPLKSSLIVAVVSAAITAGSLYYLQRHHAREAASLRRHNNAMRVQISQRWHERLKAPVTADARPAPEAVTPADNLPVSRQSPVENYRNEGRATPLATLQTFAWACDRGDVDTVRRLLQLDPGARPKIGALQATLPENVRAEWKTVDDVAVAMVTLNIMFSPFPNADVLATATPELIRDGRVRLRLPDLPKDNTEYQQTAEGWSFVLTEAMADHYIRRYQESQK